MWEYIDETFYGPCPTFRSIAAKRGCENPNHNKKLDIKPQNSYTMNGYLGSQEEGGVLKVDQVRNPVEIFFFGEENNWSLRPDHPKYAAEWLSSPLSTKALDDMVLSITVSPQAGDCFATYHGDDLNQGFGNIAFVDGHVEFIMAEDQLRKTMHGGSSDFGPGGNLHLAWAAKSPPPGGWEAQ